MATARAPKQWCLSKTETITTFESWRQNLTYILSLDKNFSEFLVPGKQWKKYTKDEQTRGLTDDTTGPEADRRTALWKVVSLEMMLGQIANFAPILTRNTIVRNSVSLDSIWQALRRHYGFHTTGAHFADYAKIKFEADESPEDLYQRLLAFAEDNLMTADCGIRHHGEQINDEELTPLGENLLMLQWLTLIHPGLPELVQQKYGSELRNQTLASIRAEVSLALSSLLSELKSSDQTRVFLSKSRLFSNNNSASNVNFNNSKFNTQSNSFSKGFSVNRSHPSRSHGPPGRQSASGSGSRGSGKSCPLCKALGVPSDHFLSQCSSLPDSDKRFMARARATQVCESDYESDHDGEGNHSVHFSDTVEYNDCQDPPASTPAMAAVTRRVRTGKAPLFKVFRNHKPAELILDSGSESSLIKLSKVQSLGVPILATQQTAVQADGCSPLSVVGETRFEFVRDGLSLLFDGLIVEDMDVEIIAGIPFMEQNDISIHFKRRLIALSNGSTVGYSQVTRQPGLSGKVSSVSVRATQLLRNPADAVTLWPGSYIDIPIPHEFPRDCALAIEPRRDLVCSLPAGSGVWPEPEIVEAVGSSVRLVNHKASPIHVAKSQHICQASLAVSTDDPTLVQERAQYAAVTPTSSSEHIKLDDISVDPDSVLPTEIRAKFVALHQEFKEVFSARYKGYNGASGPFTASVNMGPVLPPQRKGKLPLYNRKNLVLQQQMFDDLESLGVLQRPEDIGISVENVSPSFLVAKPNGRGWRLVTAFAEIGQYCRPTPSLMPTIDNTLRTISAWKYIIATDLTHSFFQVPLDRDSMRFCGVVTPFKGVRVYVRAAMGMPGSETALEELMCRVFGQFAQDGFVAKIADDLFVGGDTPQELLDNWSRVLEAAHRNDLVFAAPKTVIGPLERVILGWLWSSGSIRACPHRISALVSCELPEKVKDMRSFIGAYKFLSRVLPRCADFVAPLDDAIAGLKSSDKCVLSSECRDAFVRAQDALKNCKDIVVPCSRDLPWVVTDGCVAGPGLGATLYVTRSGRLYVAGFFSAKLPKRQVDWSPCEIEGLSIAGALQHFGPVLTQSTHKGCVLTDNKACVEAYQKLCKGSFSCSSRLVTFLSTASRYAVSVRHLAGRVNLPSDFESRNAPPCKLSNCQICVFLRETAESVVSVMTVEGVSSGQVTMPYTTRSTWYQSQRECPDLRRVIAHLRQGTRPSKKATGVRDVKRYLQVSTLSADGVVVVSKAQSFAPSRQCIVVPRAVSEGLFTALHIKLDHPTLHQFKLVVGRYFY